MEQEIIEKASYERYCDIIKAGYVTFSHHMARNFGDDEGPLAKIQLKDGLFGGYFIAGNVEEGSPSKIGVGTRAMRTPILKLRMPSLEEQCALEEPFTKLIRARYACMHETAHHLHYSGNDAVKHNWSNTPMFNSRPKDLTIEFIAELAVKVYYEAAMAIWGTVWMENESPDRPLNRYVEEIYMQGKVVKGSYFHPTLRRLAVSSLEGAVNMLRSNFGEDFFERLAQETTEWRKRSALK